MSDVLQWIVAVASAITAIATTILAIGLWAAWRQLREQRASIRAQILFGLMSHYGDPDVGKAVKLIAKSKFRSLTEFEQEFRENPQDRVEADSARRRIKNMLSPMGYLLKYRIMSTKELFPLVPAAVELWDRLGPMEQELLKQSGRTKAYDLGYDEVALVEFLYRAYQKKFQSK